MPRSPQLRPDVGVGRTGHQPDHQVVDLLPGRHRAAEGQPAVGIAEPDMIVGQHRVAGRVRRSGRWRAAGAGPGCAARSAHTAGSALSRVRSIGPVAPASTHQTAPPTLTRATARRPAPSTGCSQLKLRSCHLRRQAVDPDPAADQQRGERDQQIAAHPGPDLGADRRNRDDQPGQADRHAQRDQRADPGRRPRRGGPAVGPGRRSRPARSSRRSPRRPTAAAARAQPAAEEQAPRPAAPPGLRRARHPAPTKSRPGCGDHARPPGQQDQQRQAEGDADPADLPRRTPRAATAPTAPTSIAGMIKEGSKATSATSTTPAPQPPRQASGVRTRRSTRARTAMDQQRQPDRRRR